MFKFDSSQVQKFEFPEFRIVEEPSEEEGAPPIKKVEHIRSADAEETRVADFQPLEFTNLSPTHESPVLNSATDDEKIILAENFRVGEFIPEASLLSNAEQYAKSIREGAEIYAERMKIAAEEKYAQAEQVKLDADAIKRAADHDRTRLLKETEMEVEKIRKKAYEDGFRQGQIEGLNQRYVEAEPQIQQLEALFDQLKNLRQVIRFQSEQELVQLAVLTAKNVVMEELTVNPDVLYNILRAALKEIEALGKIRVFLNPEDYDFIEKAQAQLQNYLNEEQTLMIKPSVDVAPGTLLIETDENIINYAFEKQFAAVEDALSRKLAERHSRLNEVDMDAYDFSLSEEHSDADTDLL
ncbi:MAG: hypothetical protein HQM12_08275 [SAR324 cluster bacterium]|nr:hypothetical protein [SAR324 cluster bacterium]